MRSRLSKGRILSFAFACLLLATGSSLAQEQSLDGPWNFDSITPVRDATTAADAPAREVYAFLLKMMDLWNQHDLDGYMGCFWNSPALVDIVDSEVHIGWLELRKSYENAFITVNDMGTFTANRVQIRMVTDTIAFALTRWSLSSPGSSHPISGIDSRYIRKFSNGWKVISAHTSSAEL